MGYIVKEDGTRAWSTTELNCPQTEAGECVCQDSASTSNELFDKADEIVEAATAIDKAGEQASLADIAKLLPDVLTLEISHETGALDNEYNPAEIWEYNSNGFFYIKYTEMEPGDLVTVFAPFPDTIDSRLLPYIRKGIIGITGDYYGNHTTEYGKYGVLDRPIMIFEQQDAATRLYEYIYSSSISSFSHTAESGWERPKKGRRLSQIEDFGAYALTGTVYNLSRDAFLDTVYYSFLKYAFIADGGVYLQFKVLADKTETSKNTSVNHRIFMMAIDKDGIIKAIERDMTNNKI